MISVSDRASEKIRALLVAEDKPATRWGLRVGVEGGGCSGLQYRLDITEERPGDVLYEHLGARVYIDPKSVQFIDGSIVDFSDALTGAGFKVVNPLEKNSCGCGQSFTV